MQIRSMERPIDIDKMALEARNSREEQNKLIEQFLPFIKSRAVKYSGKGGRSQHDDLISIAMTSFYEAIGTYDKSKGHFIPFAELVIANRIIDHTRLHSKHEGKTVSFHEVDDDDNIIYLHEVNKASIRNAEIQKRTLILLEEIEEFKSEAKVWGITMESLVKASPKHKELREVYKDVIIKICNDSQITEIMRNKKYFPIKLVSERTGLSIKKLERGRAFIIASIIIRTGDYELLISYVK